VKRRRYPGCGSSAASTSQRGFQSAALRCSSDRHTDNHCLHSGRNAAKFRIKWSQAPRGVAAATRSARDESPSGDQLDRVCPRLGRQAATRDSGVSRLWRPTPRWPVRLSMRGDPCGTTWPALSALTTGLGGKFQTHGSPATKPGSALAACARRSRMIAHGARWPAL
jgi:hypothetical protein